MVAPDARRSDYELALERLEAELTELAGAADATDLDVERATALAARTYDRASLTGDLEEVAAAGSIADRVLDRYGPWPDLSVLRATIDLTLHRPDRVRADLERSPGAAESRDGRGLLAEVAVHDGRFEEARAVYEELIRDDRTWRDLGRLAHLEGQAGDLDRADHLYAEAEDELTAKQMRAYAWVELQRGLLDLARGRHDDARAHYELADRAFGGYWLVDRHLADLLAAEGRVDEAIAILDRLAKTVPRPELVQTLGALYERKGLHVEAADARERARASFLDAARRGHVHYDHHLAELDRPANVHH